MTAQTFYQSMHYGNRFGIKAPIYGPQGHRGQDFNGMPIGTDIPAWCSGVVAENYYSNALGNVISIMRPDGLRAGYCHMENRSPLNTGEIVTFEQPIGQLGATGTAALGPHLHATLGGNPSYGAVQDPLPYIVNALTAAANVAPPKPLQKRKNQMATIIVAPDTSCGFLLTRADGGPGLSVISDVNIIVREESFGNFPIPVSQDQWNMYLKDRVN